MIALDFSKAFDTVRLSTLLEEIAMLEITDQAYNWLVNVFNDHSHCTNYKDSRSGIEQKAASVIQGCIIGPATYLYNVEDLKQQDLRNAIYKFDDDTYLLIGASAIDTRTNELNSIEIWARLNNLKLNRAKSEELICSDNRRKAKVLPPPTIAVSIEPNH